MFLNKAEIFSNNYINTQYSGNTESNSSTKIPGLDANGNIPLVAEQEDFVVQKDPRDIIAEKKGYVKTGNADIYKEEKSGQYFVWNNDKQKFVKDKNIQSVHGNGFTEKINPNYGDGKKVFIYNPQGKEIGRADDFNVRAQVKGFVKPPKYWNGQHYFEELFFNPKDEKYYYWDKGKQNFKKTNFEIAGNDLIKGGNSYYKISEKGWIKVSAENFYAKKYNMVKRPEQKGVYYINNSPDNKDYVFDPKTNTFICPSQQIRDGMIAQKADGVVGNFTQGDTGDCWLMAALEALRPEIMEKVKDENGNEVDRIKSEYLEIDPETGDMTVKLKGPGVEYVITDAEINEALSQLNPKYSYGEKEIVAIEMALQNFIKDCVDKRVVPTVFLTPRGIATDDELHGGYPSDVMTTLTGLKTGKFSKKDIKAGTIESLLDNKIYFCTNMNTEYTGTTNHHAIVVVGYDDENIYYDDSNNETGEPLSMKKEDFYRMCYSIEYANPNEKLHKTHQQIFQNRFGI